MARKSSLFSEELTLPHCPRPGFLVYLEDWEAVIQATTPDQRGQLIDSIFYYVRYGEVPDFSTDPCLSLAWGFLAPKLDRDQETYNANTWKNRYNAYKRGQENPLEPDKWFRQVTSGDQWLLSESVSETETESGNKSESVSENESVSASEAGDGEGTGKGIMGEGEPSFEEERARKIRMLTEYQ